MKHILKTIFIFIGGLTLGIGAGIITAKTTIWRENYYWLISSLALILGGFFIAIGALTKPAEKKKELPSFEKGETFEGQETRENDNQTQNS